MNSSDGQPRVFLFLLCHTAGARVDDVSHDREGLYSEAQSGRQQRSPTPHAGAELLLAARPCDAQNYREMS